jgi:hypothetical protein
VSYNADDTTTTGLGLRIHFDSLVLSASDVTALVGTDLLVNGVVESDDGDLDGDASTDQIISFGWASLFGNWPNAAPADLASITFDIAEGATGSSAINFTASSNAAGFAFAGQNHEIAILGEAAPVESQLSIDAVTGTVTLSTNPDYETQNQYSFEVVATDAAGNASEAQSVSLGVNNLDEVAPTITSGDTASAVNENSGAGQVVYSATATDDDDISEGYSFSLADDSLGFSIDAGVVTTNADFSADFEDAQSQSFTVVATDEAGNASEQIVTIAVNNLDEVAPTITSGATAVAIDENSGAGQVVYSATATDDDDISEGYSFSLANNSLGFSIDADTGVVTTNADFSADFEDAQSQSFTVVATDEAGNASEQIVTIAVNNLDEVAPKITSGATAVAIDENSGANQVIYTAIADDSDDISDGFTFSLAEDSDVGLSIDASTGVVTLATNPDHEAQSQYDFAVIATDTAGNASEAQSVTLDINNLDDTAPNLTSDLDPRLTDYIDGSIIYTATSEDADLLGTDTNYSIDGITAAVSPAKTIIEKDGYIRQVFEANDDSTYSLKLFLSESKESTYSDTGLTNYDLVINYDSDEVSVLEGILPSVIFDLGDVSFNATVPGKVIISAIAFPTALAVASDDSMPEPLVEIKFSLEQEAISSQFEVDNIMLNTDDYVEDAAASSIARYQIESNLVIDSESGEVSIVNPPLIPTEYTFEFTVIATDAVGNASETPVTVEIDPIPVINSPDVAEANENSGAGQVIYTATLNKGVQSFRLAEGSDPAITIVSETGEVSLNTDPDFETQDQYSFAVIATDSGGVDSEAKSVTLTINNMDESSPVFTSGSIVDAINENSGEGQVIYTAVADDTADISGGVTFSLDSTGLASGLSIDAITGEVTLTANPDFESQSQYSFGVIASDGVNAPAFLQELTLEINNLDEVAPTITSGATAVAIDENSGANQVVYTAIADDSDDISDGFTFSLAEDSDVGLSIDASTGVVTLATNPDHEAQSQYDFAVIATDTAGNASEAQSVTLDINNLDESAPNITSDTEVNVVNNGGDNQVIYTAVADDSSDISGGVTFSFAEGSDAVLSIDAATGTVTLNEIPDPEVESQYNFTIIATDAAGNVGQEKAVTVSVNFVDETAPVITSSGTGTFDENIGADQAIYIATANDDADNAAIVYSLNDTTTYLADGDSSSGSAESTVSIPELAADTQHVYVSSSAKSEDGTQETVVVSYNADDTTTTGLGLRIHFDSLVLSASDVTALVGTDLLVNGVVESDDGDLDGDASTDQIISFGWASLFGNWPNAAPADLASITFDIAEGATGSSAINFTASSNAAGFAFAGQNHEIAILGEAAPVESQLSIDAVTGTVTLSTNPDYETQNQYSFEVVATDAAGNASEAQSVSLGVNNLDEVAPTITSGDTASAVNENSGAGQVVYSATATDDDDISEGYSFSLADDSLGFSIDAGVVTTNADFSADFEDAQSQSFTVVATDEAGNASEQIVTIAVNNLDEVAPTITSGATAVAIDENSGANQVIYTAIADDSDDISDGFTFSLAEDSDVGLSIDASTGEVTTNADFSADFEDAQSQSFTVVATDEAGNASEQIVTIAVNNLDEVAPKITSGATAVAIDENSGANQVIYTAIADDSADISDGFTFSLAEDSDVGLSIDASTGVVTLATNPDHEAQSQYDFAVIATDTAGNASEAQSVTLDINNLDEAAPIITSAAETVVVDLGDTDPVIYTATADDSVDISGGVSYSLNDTTVYASAGSALAESTVSIPELAAATQHVYVSSSTKSEDGTQETVVVSYNADDSTTTGLGLRIHFDSSVLSASDIAALITSDMIAGGVVELDGSDLDGDTSTDKYIAFGWAAMSGQWPGSAPADLASITFDIAEGATGSSAINFTASSNAAGFALDGQSHEVAITGEAVTVESQLSIDSATGVVTLSGELDPATQSEYSFTVTASDTAGNSSDLDVAVDAEQPTVDPAMVVVVDGDTPSAPIYQASANIENVSYQITDLTQYPDTDSGSGLAESQISIPQLAAATQHVYVSESTKSEDGSQETVVVTYNADDSTTTGLGLRIHFDSSVLSASDITALITSDMIAGGVVELDGSDLDGDASTDQYIAFGWAAMSGQWPGSAPADLASITF